MHLYYTELVLICIYCTHTPVVAVLQIFMWVFRFSDQLCFLKISFQPDLQTTATIFSGFKVFGLKTQFHNMEKQVKNLYSPTWSFTAAPSTCH